VRSQAHQRPSNDVQGSKRLTAPRDGSGWYRSADELSVAVDNCFRAADREHSKLTSGVLSVPGMTSRRIRHLLNRLGELPGCRYLEVGTFYGATVLAASFDNPGSFISVDDFSEFNEPDPRPVLHSLLKEFKDHCHVDFREVDCWKLPSVLPPNSVNVYFYDGTHSREAQSDALRQFADLLTDPFVLLVDDWNIEFVQEGTRDALLQLGWSLHKEWCRRTHYNGDAESWWNGLFVAVVEKVRRSRRENLRRSLPLPAVSS
jgi:hypothetical protein